MKWVCGPATGEPYMKGAVPVPLLPLMAPPMPKAWVWIQSHWLCAWKGAVAPRRVAMSFTRCGSGLITMPLVSVRKVSPGSRRSRLSVV